MNEDKNILILRYINGDLSNTEKIAFEKELHHNEELKKEFENYNNIYSSR